MIIIILTRNDFYTSEENSHNYVSFLKKLQKENII
jgi:hypothetical protein